MNTGWSRWLDRRSISRKMEKDEKCLADISKYYNNTYCIWLINNSTEKRVKNRDIWHNSRKLIPFLKPNNSWIFNYITGLMFKKLFFQVKNSLSTFDQTALILPMGPQKFNSYSISLIIWTSICPNISSPIFSNLFMFSLIYNNMLYICNNINNIK